MCSPLERIEPISWLNQLGLEANQIEARLEQSSSGLPLLILNVLDAYTAQSAWMKRHSLEAELRVSINGQVYADSVQIKLTT